MRTGCGRARLFPERRIASLPFPPGPDRGIFLRMDRMHDYGRKALVLFSGGQDSTTCLAWALSAYDAVETIGFDYGQRHRVELECRGTVLRAIRSGFPDWSGKLGEDHIVDLGVIGRISETALTREVEIVMQENGLPSTFVPGRNLLFLTFAAMTAYRRGFRHLVAGFCETDYSGYPDCRDDSVKAMQVALNLGMDTRFVVHAPLMWIDKAATWKLTDTLGGEKLVELVRSETHSCYHGERGVLHPWGHGCGICPACNLRREGWERFRSAA